MCLGNFSKKTLFLCLVASAALFGVTVFISGQFNPYEELAESGSSLLSQLNLRMRFIFSEAYNILQMSGAVDGMEKLPAFQEFPLSNILWIALIGSTLAMMFFWNIFERDFFDTIGCSSTIECVMVWAIHYFVNFSVMYLISIIAIELTYVLNWIFCSMARTHMALGVLFWLIVAPLLIFLYMFCFVQAIRWLKYFIAIAIPLLALDYLGWGDLLFDSDAETLLHRPVLLLGLLALLIYSRVGVEMFLMSDGDD